jgi:hypothetical protein
MPNKVELKTASARTLGVVVRKALKQKNLPWKVYCKTVSFEGIGYGSEAFATVRNTRTLTYIELSMLADVLRDLRADPDGGKGIISLLTGGYIGYKDYPSGAAFWRQVGKDLQAAKILAEADPTAKANPPTAVIKEAARRVLLAYEAEKPARAKEAWCKEWVQYCLDHPETRSLGWPDIYVADEAPSGWPGIAAFEGRVIKP